MRDDRLNWKKAKDAFRLINEDVDMAKPQDVSYVFNGLAPLSVKLIELLLAEKGLAKIQKCKLFVFSNLLLHRMQAAQSDHFKPTRRRIRTFQSFPPSNCKPEKEGAGLFPGWHHVRRDLSDPVPEHSVYRQTIRHSDNVYHQCG